MHRRKFAFIFVHYFICFCFCDVSFEKKEKLLNSFVDYLKNLPDQPFVLREGVLQKVVEFDPNSYYIETQIKVEDSSNLSLRYVKCTGNLYERQESVVEVASNYQCYNDIQPSTVNQIEDGITESISASTIEINGSHQPVQLDNEVQTESFTSGEQFIAVPRESMPCIGCASQVNPDAAGVSELALLGVNQLNTFEPNVQHSLNKVISVERQVQVVNGVRYILTILVDYNGCSDTVTEACFVTKACRVSILNKPWIRLPDGSKYKIVVANNCTEAWLFDGQESEDNHDKSLDITPDYSNIRSIGPIDDIIKNVRNPEVQVQPEIEKTLTDEDIKDIEQQITPNKVNNAKSEFQGQESDIRSYTPVPDTISEDKKKAIDDLLYFYDYAGLNQNKDSADNLRIRRSYEKDLFFFNLAEKFDKMKKSINDAKIIYKYAQLMVDYLNEIDFEITNRVLSHVIAAEEEIEKKQKFIYIKALIVIPCEKVKRDTTDELIKICNGIIDVTNQRSPQVITTFCYNHDAKKVNIGKINYVSLNDPVLSKLALLVLLKMERESPDNNALKIIKIISANTQKASGTLTKLLIVVGSTNCNKTKDLRNRVHCNVMKKLGSKICEVEIFGKEWIKKDHSISYTCNNRPIEESLSSGKISIGNDDPDVLEILQEAIEFLDIQSDKNNKHKIVEVNTVSTQLVAGLLTNIHFTVGDTLCINDINVDVSKCDLIEYAPLRYCSVQVWHRPWLEDGRQVNVSCEPTHEVVKINRDKRQVVGGETLQNSNDPKYKALAEESLQKYVETSGSSGVHRITTVDTVTTQIPSGMLTKIDFTVTNSNSDVIKCHSEVWEQVWMNKKEIEVTCNIVDKTNREKRQALGGETLQNSNDPKYKALAEESLLKYLETSGSSGVHRIATVDLVTTQVVEGMLTKINFTVTNSNSDEMKCHSEVWEQVWMNKKEIEVTCNIVDKTNREKRQALGGETLQNSNDPKYKALAEESLQKYVETSGSSGVHRITTVDTVTTQIRSGMLTKIDFTVTNSNSDVIKCHSEVWEQVWMNKKEIEVTCNIVDKTNREKRQALGLETLQNSNDPKYKALAEESLQKYLETSGSSGVHRIATVDLVTTQVVKGMLTKIDFTVTNSNSDVIKCHSEVWEQVWMNKKEIEVTCNIVDKTNREKRQALGLETLQNSNDPKYKALAEESLQKYLETSGSSGVHRIATVDLVTTQVVKGMLTKINFTVTNSNSDEMKCHSEVWEQVWMNKKEIEVTCNIVDKTNREKRQALGGETLQNSNDPKYKALAEESLQKYVETSGSSGVHRITTVDTVTTQIRSGMLTKIDFTVTNSNSDVIKCHSEVWEQVWMNKKEIEVTCNIVDKTNREKRQALGLETLQNSNDPKYKALAEESLQKYLETSGSSGVHRIATVDLVTTQVVKGMLTKIDFTVTNSNSDVIKCHSEVWEQVWMNKKEIEVTCNIVDKTNREKRQALGLETLQNSNDPKYKALAEESLQKYLETSGSSGVHRIATVDLVTTQVVKGMLTKINFTVTNSNSDEMKCHSEVWEQVWMNKKEIEVTCNIVDKTNREKRQALGGETLQNSNDPKYKALAEESLQKYVETSGSSGVHRITTVDTVTTQIRSGMLTKIDFTVTNSNSDEMKCHSEVWEQVWMNKKEIEVTCNIVDKTNREKRQALGGETLQNSNDPKYKALAEESLQKYLETSGSSGVHRIATVDLVTTQVVKGMLTKINFTVTNSNSDEMKCHSEVWEQVWMNKKEIEVTCNIVDKTNREKRQALGGETLQNSNDPKYKALAEESLQKYVETSGSSGVHRITTVDTVTTQIRSGMLTKIDFTVTNSNSDVIKCHSEVWEQVWMNKKEIEVTCNIVDKTNREKRHISSGGIERNSVNPTDPEYRYLDFNFYGKHKNGEHDGLGKKLTDYKKSRGHNVGIIVEQDPTKHQYQVLAAESLFRHQRLLQNKTHRYKVLEVKKVLTQVVAGTIYKIDYTAVPTTCSMNVLDVSACERVNENTILYCHAEIWSRPWQKRQKIDVSCVDDYDDDDEGTGDVRSKRGLLGGVEIKNANRVEYRKMAERALTKYEKSSKSEYFHKIIKMKQVSVQVVAGLITNIKFSITPTICLRNEMDIIKDDCELKKPISSLKCFAKITEHTVDGYDDDIYVNCRRSFVESNKHTKKSTDLHAREKRETRLDGNDIDEDTKFYYADQAVQYLNEHSNTDNLQKLITIHDVLGTVQMNTHMVRMYIETAPTYCLRHDTESDLGNCDELDGTSHRLCLAKIFPSSDDELIILRVAVVCDDEPDFRKTTGLSIPDLLTISLVYLEDSKDINYKLVHRGEPNVIPSLHSNIPVKLSFIVASTNCSKHVDNNIDDVLCFVDTTIPDKSCQSFIWMIPATKKIIHVKANCSEHKQIRLKRYVTDQNVTTDIEEMLQQSLEKLEMGSLHRYKQRVMKINSYSTKITSGKVTTIDFDVGYTDCLKHEWLDNITKCNFLEHLPRRHCVSEVWERLWLQNGRDILVNCQDDETPLEGHIEIESAETAMQLAQQALKHIEAKYPHPRKQQVVRIFSLERQAIAGLHYRMKIEVGFTNCLALSGLKNCQLINDGSLNRFCRVNVWLRPWTYHPPNYRVSCDYQSGATSELYHLVQSEQLFYNFLTTYKPEYVNDNVELTKRFEIFKNNIKKIHELNTYEMGTATYAVTRFADLTYDEFSRKYLGVKQSLRNPNHIPMSDAKIPKVHVPESFDWRESGAVTAVKDQGSCGSCWAFSVTGNIEGQWKLKTGQLLSLSEQELVDCDKLDSGCNGGLMDNAYRAIEQLGGLEPEDAYPYAGEDDKCLFNKTLAKVQISGAVNITSNETDIAKWLVRNGPISIGINANAMQFYVGGVSHPWKMLCNPKNIDHGVLIVGYGVKDYPLFHKRLPYWIVKNSWGPSWGEQGYYRVYRGDGTCGVNTMASSAVV